MKKTAVLIDAGFLRMWLPKTTTFQDTAKIVQGFAFACVAATDDEELFRVLYYDCKPYDGDGRQRPHPISGAIAPVSAGRQNFGNSLLTLLKKAPYFAVRLGEVSFDGWALSDQATQSILQTHRPITPNDFEPILRQKGVDLRIGIDVALMAKDNLVDRIVVVTGDADIVPAMKVARREGVQVVLVSLGHAIKASLREHADLERTVHIAPIIATVAPATAST